MRRLFVFGIVLSAFVTPNAYSAPLPCDCFGGIDTGLSPSYWYLLDETGYTLENGDWVYVAWTGPDGIMQPPSVTWGNWGDVTGDDVIIEEGVIYYGYFTITVITYAPEDRQHPWAGEEIYCRMFTEPKPPSQYAWWGDSDQHVVGNFLGETFFAKFPGDPYYGCCDILLPVELMSFEALGRTDEVMLEWKTASEVNNFGFHIERSRDEVCFERITQEVIPGAGNSTIEHTYTYLDKGLINETCYYYNLITVDMDGVEMVANENPVAATPLAAPLLARVPDDFFLRQNYPNPFNPVTEIAYAIPKDVHVTLKVYNVLGAEVETLADVHQQAGFYTVGWDAEGLASGVYFCTLSAGDFQAIKKMVLLK